MPNIDALEFDCINAQTPFKGVDFGDLIEFKEDI